MNGLTTTDFYMKFFPNNNLNLMDRVASCLDPKVIINFLKKLNCRDYEKLIGRVVKLIEFKGKIFYRIFL